MISDGDRMPNAAKAIELGLEGEPVSRGTCSFGVRGTTLTLDDVEASESDAASLPSMEVVGVNGGVAGVTTCGSVERSTGWELVLLGTRLDCVPGL